MAGARLLAHQALSPETLNLEAIHRNHSHVLYNNYLVPQYNVISVV